MPAMPQSWPDVLGSVQVSDYMYGANLPGTTAEEGVLPRVRGGGRGGVAIDASSESTRHGAGVPGRLTPPPTGGPKLLGLFIEKSYVASVPSGWVPGRGLKSDQLPGLLCAPPHLGHNSDPGGRESTVSQMPPV